MSTSLPELQSCRCDCEECGKSCYVLAEPDDMLGAEFCPFCGLDGYGAHGLTNPREDKLEEYRANPTHYNKAGIRNTYILGCTCSACDIARSAGRPPQERFDVVDFKTND